MPSFSETTVSSGQKKQQSISSFFSPKAGQPSTATSAKRRSPSVGETNEDDLLQNVEPPSKRQKTPMGDGGDGSYPERTAPSYSASAQSDRTSRYLFGSARIENAEEDEKVTKEKQRLHQKFVKKLGRPDSIAEIKRRNNFISEDASDDREEAVEDDEQEEPELYAPRKGIATKKKPNKLTPMEQQYLDIKRKHLDTILVVEVGYKFKFFGEDARVAAKELSIVCIPGKFRYDEHPSEAHLDRFASASIPVHRLHVHVKRLVSAGHKVGVVRQLETAALKAAGDNRNTPFVRKLTNLYTKGTYIDDVEGLEDSTAVVDGAAPATGHLLCLTETNAKGWGTDEKVHVGIVAVQPATGDVVYDDFEDGFMRSEIETRLLHISPCEFLIVGNLSKATDKLIQHLAGRKTTRTNDKARIEHADKPKTAAAQSYSHLSSFYKDKLKSDEQPDSLLDKVHRLSEPVTICLSAMITHLSAYGLEHVFDLTRNFQAFSARSHMLLNGNTLTSLEIYQNQTDREETGSLFWVLDQTYTRFGQRMLRKWVGRPLLDKARLQERLDAVEELRSVERTGSTDKLRALLSKVKSDLEKSLIRIYYKKCLRSELLVVLQTLQRISSEYAHVRSPEDAGFQSNLINESIAHLPVILQDVLEILEKINTEAARKNDKYDFLREEHETDKIKGHRHGIADVERELNLHRKVAAEKLRKSKVEYVTVAGIDYLIEVDNNNIKNVPASWAKISGTKKVSRFHTPEVMQLIKERDQHKESLAAACDEAFTSLVSSIASKYQAFRDCIQALSILDCLMSFATVANRPNYCKPTFTDSVSLSVVGGRHPMVEQLLLESYVPNDIDLSSSATRALLITGPNMGGKSSYVRQVALISIMAQCGSYVPAASAELGMLDAIFTRMGAFDNMMSGESTFMVELSETSDMLRQATPRSLIILDELGRGTSTHDGVAIAYAVLDHIVRDKQSLLLFITHYQSLSTVASAFPDDALRNMHMRFTEVTGENNEQDITFLYELAEGVAHRSYGLNVAKLANIPKPVIDLAAVKSKDLERDIRHAQLEGLVKLLSTALNDGQRLDNLIDGIDQL